MTRAQARALAESGPDLVVGGDDGAPDRSPDWTNEFGRDAPLGLEIGFGMGHALLDWAEQNPHWNLVGIEVYQPGIGSLLLGMKQRGLTNVRVVAEAAQTALARFFQPASLGEVRIFFPDPWPKKRHHKRRLVQPEFAALLASRLRAGGQLLLATDWQDYADSMLEVLDAQPMLTNVAGSGHFSPRAETRRSTRFEDRGRQLGHAVRDLCYARKR